MLTQFYRGLDLPKSAIQFLDDWITDLGDQTAGNFFFNFQSFKCKL